MLAVLLAVGGVAVARARNDAAKPEREPTPSASAPAALEGSSVFAHVTVVRPPKAGEVKDVLLHFGEPAFVTGITDLRATVVGAFGGPEHARVLVGWCAPARVFQDATGTYRYDRNGAPLTTGDALPVFRTRPHGDDLIDIASVGTVEALEPEGQAGATPCTERLRYPRLPARVADVHDTIHGFRLVTGRYVVSTDSKSFCAPVTEAGCATQGWEAYRLGSLPPGDLAGSYTWEGDFLVRGDQDGHLSAVRLPGVGAPRRTDVGTSAVRGLVRSVESGDPLTVVLDNGRQIAVPREADVFLGRGRTGLGRPAGTAVTLREFLLTTSGQPPFWFVLDARGQAIRVVIDD